MPYLELAYKELFMNENSTSLKKTKCDAELYFDIQRQMNETGKMPQVAKNILKFIEQQSDLYHLNEFEMALLTGLNVYTLRNDRRSKYADGKEVITKWPFHKGDSQRPNNNAKVSYILGEVRSLTS